MVLAIGEAVVVLALAALAGVLAARRWAWGATLVVVLGAVAGLAAMGRPDAGTLAAAPAVVGAIAGLLTLRELVRRLPGAPQRPRPEGVERRTFLQATAAAGALGVVGAAIGRVTGAGARGAQSARSAIQIPRPATTAAPVPAGVDIGVDGVEPWQTPADEFYRIDTALVVPQVDPQTWSLRVHGMVEEEVTLTWDELLDSDLVEAWVTLACVSNPVGGDLIGNSALAGHAHRGPARAGAAPPPTPTWCCPGASTGSRRRRRSRP